MNSGFNLKAKLAVISGPVMCFTITQHFHLILPPVLEYFVSNPSKGRKSFINDALFTGNCVPMSSHIYSNYFPKSDDTEQGKLYSLRENFPLFILVIFSSALFLFSFTTKMIIFSLHNSCFLNK